MKFTRRKLLASSAAWLVAPGIAKAWTHGSAAAAAAWQQLYLGAGGLLTNVHIGSDGTTVVGTDTYGGWLSTNRAAGWYQGITQPSIAAITDPLVGGTMIETAIAPSNPAIMYCIFTTQNNTYVISSSNRGQTWSNTNFTPIAKISVGDPNKQFSPQIAVDPQNANICVVGTSAGVFYTTNGGSAWTQITTGNIPAATAPSGSGSTPTTASCYLIAFDTTSSVSGGATQGIYISSYGNGLYHTTTGLAGTWSQATGSSGTMPTTYRNLLCDQFGNVWVIDGGTQGHINVLAHSGSTIFTGGAWTSLSTLGNQAGIAIDPSINTESSSRIFAIEGNNGPSGLTLSVTGGGVSSWVFNSNASLNGNPVAPITWIINQNETEAAINIAFDPSGSNLLCATTGDNFWYCNPPNNSTSAINWFDQGGHGTGTTGIEQLVTTRIISPWTSGSQPLIVVWDKIALLANPASTSYPTTTAEQSSPQVTPGWDADWASNSPGTLILISSALGTQISTNGGSSWSVASASQDTGACAMATPTNWIWVGDTGGVFNTTNGGSSFNAVSGLPTTDWITSAGGPTGGNFILAADRVTIGNYYAFNWGTQTIYSSTDGLGATWSSVNSTFISAFANLGVLNSQLRAVPNNAGHLFFSTNYANTGSNYGPTQATTTGTTSTSQSVLNVPTTGMYVKPNITLIYDVTQGGALVGTASSSTSSTVTLTANSLINVASGDVLMFSGPPLFRSTNGGATMTALLSVHDVIAHGFGAPKPGGSGYPAIYIIGYVGATYGVWRSDDAASTWNNIGTYPLGSLDAVKCIEGDANIWNQCYVGYSGSGAVVYLP